MNQGRWRQIAILAHYGNQPLSEIWRLTKQEADDFQAGLEWLIKMDNGGSTGG